ncbi:hypothetical protein Rleg4DRAFT_6990 [Rhizobium leguminosarum bv. trifolii WSM2297]|uniref:Uncharacterized protein n=1 Tax=Rhizobium leguminosarum bv. trifolii WSM2297 TaxID=754762 RepID=J0WDJ7_RHILT|nr:hypothetical protein Rleg4DRAFT_5031 [Rhizobium leguminosarum bv. trifolii WSM2297]EJC85123.1 hypothetical protein Rleg4DRAFT_6990 [Rhizobium leguminosarum bv. trifolii WSM2297]
MRQAFGLRLAELAGQIPKRYFHVVFEGDRSRVSQQECAVAKHDLQVQSGDIRDPIGRVFKKSGGIANGQGFSVGL